MNVGAIVGTSTDGFKTSWILTYDQARKELKDNLLDIVGVGNYSLYGKPEKQLVIHGNGQRWDDIRNWARSIYYTQVCCKMQEQNMNTLHFFV